jgi:hypothetical protein
MPFAGSYLRHKEASRCVRLFPKDAVPPAMRRRRRGHESTKSTARKLIGLDAIASQLLKVLIDEA